MISLSLPVILAYDSDGSKIESPSHGIIILDVSKILWATFSIAFLARDSIPKFRRCGVSALSAFLRTSSSPEYNSRDLPRRKHELRRIDSAVSVPREYYALHISGVCIIVSRIASAGHFCRCEWGSGCQVSATLPGERSCYVFLVFIKNILSITRSAIPSHGTGEVLLKL